MPASGASITRLGIVRPPSSHGSCSERTTSTLGIAFPDDAKTREREQVVGDVDRAAVRDHGAGEAAGGERLEVAELGVQAVDDPVAHARVAVEHAGADGV